ncbi:MAG TPA: hypothetical protein VMU80_11360 [Bryobacteraceae bacterium]|nr:hypothetical protein [Bryobacteraceae bacterium]
MVPCLAAGGGIRAQMMEMVVHSFASPPHGATPGAGLLRDSQGSLYGILGGSQNAGVVWHPLSGPLADDP